MSAGIELCGKNKREEELQLLSVSRKRRMKTSVYMRDVEL
jgi:hypothetical protein